MSNIGLNIDLRRAEPLSTNSDLHFIIISQRIILERDLSMQDQDIREHVQEMMPIGHKFSRYGRLSDPSTVSYIVGADGQREID